MKSILFRIPLLTLLALSLCSCSRSTAPDWAQNGERFLIALLGQDEPEAASYLSPSAKNAVQNNCPEGLVTRCAENVIQPDWGEFTGKVLFEYGQSNTAAFLAAWSELNHAVFIVVEFENHQGNQLVKEWRGFIVTGNADEQLLSDIFEGQQENAFP
jgi:hypothetical protein